MKRKYRVKRVRLWGWEETMVKWVYQIEYSYLGIIWSGLGNCFDSEEEVDEHYEIYIKPDIYIKYYE